MYGSRLFVAFAAEKTRFIGDKIDCARNGGIGRCVGWEVENRVCQQIGLAIDAADISRADLTSFDVCQMQGV